MCDTGQQVKQSAFVDHKFQRLGLRVSGFLNSNNEAIVYTACFVLDTLRKMYLFHTVLYVTVLHVLFHVFCFLEFYLKIIHLVPRSGCLCCVDRHLLVKLNYDINPQISVLQWGTREQNVAMADYDI